MDPQKDVLFFYRYLLSFSSSCLSLAALKFPRVKYLALVSVVLFLPFLVMQLVELYIVYRCDVDPQLDTLWGVYCDSLLVFRDDSKFIQVFTDEFAVIVLALVNLTILWRCHVTAMPPKRRVVPSLQKPLLSENLSAASFTSFQSASADPYLSAEEGEANGNEDTNPFSSPLMVIPRVPIPPMLNPFPPRYLVIANRSDSEE
jgi:hypothetical protein